MKQVIKFSKEELKAFETIASIECNGINCCNCPLNINNIPYSWVERGCYRNLSTDLLRANAQEEEKNEK